MKNRTKKVVSVVMVLGLLSMLAFSGIISAEATERAFVDENGKLHIKYYDDSGKLVNEVIKDWDLNTSLLYGLTLPS